MFDYYCANCCLLQYAVACKLLKDKQRFKFGIVMTIRYCIYVVEELEQNKWKSSEFKEEWPKNEEKLAKYANCGLSESLSEKGGKKSEASEIIISPISQHCTHDMSLKFASCTMHCIVRVNITFLDIFWRVLVHYDAFKRGFSTLSQGLRFWKSKHEIESTSGDFWSIWSHWRPSLQGTSYVIIVYQL